ncbi:MAG: hypothetical protein ACKO7D_07030 [Bacteroidota bacterium]
MKETNVLYLKSKIMALPGSLELENEFLILNAHKQTINLGGFLGSFLKKKVEEKNHGFKWNVNEIKSINKGKHGFQNNVLELTNVNDETYRILVKNFDEWNTAILNRKS